ncbi:hypothetical protein B0J14DRAFT_607897 [Halenospora varia]|nr:hypothetical protein B0J14DRAFT_607897 [Halenospora varia]
MREERYSRLPDEQARKNVEDFFKPSNGEFSIARVPDDSRRWKIIGERGYASLPGMSPMGERAVEDFFAPGPAKLKSTRPDDSSRSNITREVHNQNGSGNSAREGRDVEPFFNASIQPPEFLKLKRNPKLKRAFGAFRQEKTYDDDFEEKPIGRALPRYPVWFWPSAAGFGLAMFVLLINVTILLWAKGQKIETRDGLYELFAATCPKTRVYMAWIELAINTLSTLLLAASTNCARLLLSPTREEVDVAHAQGVWLCIGVTGMRNIKWISSWRVWICGLLFLSSVPLHLLYNSVIFSSSYANDYMAMAVTEDFVNTKNHSMNTNIVKSFFFNMTMPLHIWGTTNVLPSSYTTQLNIMGDNIQKLANLSNAECRDAFGSLKLEPAYHNVLLVTNHTQNDSFVNAVLSTPEVPSTAVYWFRNKDESGFSLEDVACRNVYNGSRFDYSKATPENWTIPQYGCPRNYSATNVASVQYCLAQKAEEQQTLCTINFSSTLMTAIVICNLIKAVCIGVVLFARDFHPLATVGDAICSFLKWPDKETAGAGLLSMGIFNGYPHDGFRALPGSEGEYIVHKWKGVKHRWAVAIRSVTCILSLIFIWLAWIIILMAMITSLKGDLLTTWSHHRVGWGISSNTPLLALVTIINSPQLAMSIIFVFYNNLTLRLAVVWEYSQYGTKRQGLRVSLPTGHQRRAYSLGTPLKYALPVMTAMMLLHWLISRGSYLVNIKVYNVVGQEEPQRMSTFRSSSSLAMLLAFTLASVMWILLMLPLWRRLGKGVPIIGFNSAAISAACHRAEGDEDAEFKPVMYGVVSTESLDERGALHAAFSSKPVKPLDDENRYQ